MQTRFIHSALTGLAAIAALLLLPATGAATDSNPGTSDGTQQRSTPRGYDGESLFPWSTLPPNGWHYSNFMELNGIKWYLGAQMTSGSQASSEGHPVSINSSYPGTGVHDLYYDMTLTGFEYSNTNSSRDIDIPGSIAWKTYGEMGVLSGSLQYIPSLVFTNKDITSVTIPYTILALQEPCFLGCRGLKSIKIVWGGSAEVTDDDRWDHTDTRYRSKDGVLYNKDMTRLIKYPEGKTDRSFAIPPTVTELSPYAFANTRLAELTISDGVKAIGAGALAGNTNLEFLSVGHGVTGLPDIPWGKKLVAVVLGNGITNLPEQSFSGCTNLASVTLGTGITEIPDLAFNDCVSLKGIAIPNSVTNIGESAFYRCFRLESVAIPDKVARIGAGAFFQCADLASVDIPDGMVSIERFTFAGCSNLTAVAIPDSVVDIGEAAFRGCTRLAGTVVIPDGVEDLGANAFQDCRGLTNVVFGKGVKRIGSFAFTGCRGLTDLTLPDSVESVGGSAFWECYGLKVLRVPAAWEGTAMLAGADLPAGCIVVYGDSPGGEIPGGEVPVEGLEGDWLYTTFKGEATVTAGPTQGAVVIPAVLGGCPVTAIEREVFSEWLTGTSPESVVFPDTVERIGRSAFYGCSALATVTLGSGLEDLGDEVFCQCTALTGMTLPESVTNIGQYAFWGCTKLQSLRIPAGVEHVGTSAFAMCTALKTLYVPASWKDTSMLAEAGVPEWCGIVYYDVEKADETTTTPVPIAHAWLDENAAGILAANGGDYEAAANAKAANGRPVWECYVAGISPAGTTDFKVTFVQENGEWVPKPTPEHPGTRRYVIEGSPAIGEGEAWGDPTENSRFFRAKAMLP